MAYLCFIVGLKRLRRFRDVTLDFDLVFTLSDLGNLICDLHPQKVIHIRTEGLVDTQCHLCGQIRLSVSKSDNVARRTPRISAAFVIERPSGSRIAFQITRPTWGGSFIAMA